MTYGPRPGDETDADEALHLVYDAWNRLVAAYKDNGTTAGEKDANDTLLAKYQYDGLHRRIAKLKPNGENWDRTDYYYSTDWQVLEERAETVAGETTPADDVKVQYVWDLRYIDAPVLRWRDTGGDPDLDETLYFCNDANMNVTALVEPDGDVVERVAYDPYGKPTFYDADWANPSDSSAYANEVLYCGYRYDTETGLYDVRHRTYHPTLGRWLQRDPIGYADAANLYQYCSGGPTVARDPSGTREHTWEEIFLGQAPQAEPTNLPSPLDALREEGAKALAEGAETMKAKCKACCCPENVQPCQEEAQRISDALVKAWQYNVGRSHSKRTHNVGGYMCWDWAKGFQDAINHIKPLFHWDAKEVSGKYKEPPPKYPNLHHFYVRLRACPADALKLGTKDEDCVVMVDDGATGAYVHEPPWQEQFPDDPCLERHHLPYPADPKFPSQGWRHTYPPIVGSPPE